MDYREHYECTTKVVDSENNVIAYMLVINFTVCIPISKENLRFELSHGLNVNGITLTSDGRMRTASFVQTVPDVMDGNSLSPGLKRDGITTASSFCLPHLTRGMLNGFGGENVTFMHRTVSNIQQVNDFVAKAALMGSGGAKHKTFDRHRTQIMDENFEYGCSVLVKFNNTTVLLTMEPFVLDCGESALSREGTFQDIEFENIYLSNKCYCTPSTSRMFSHCKIKNELDISGVDSANMMNASNMFEGLYVGGKVSGVSTLKTNNLVAANGMFKGCNL